MSVFTGLVSEIRDRIQALEAALVPRIAALEKRVAELEALLQEIGGNAVGAQHATAKAPVARSTGKAGPSA